MLLMEEEKKIKEIEKEEELSERDEITMHIESLKASNKELLRLIDVLRAENAGKLRAYEALIDKLLERMANQ